jgi:tRNA A37 N6-isopentenylltransferase MiaA
LEEAVQKTKYETHRLARHQGAWFKADDTRIHWFDISKDYKREAVREVESFLNSGAASTGSKVEAGK